MRILRADCPWEAEKRLKWTTNVSGARVIVIFLVASRCFLQRGHFQVSAESSVSTEQ